MDFGEILKRWENRPPDPKRPPRMAEWLERYPPGRETGGMEGRTEPVDPDPAGRSAALRRMQPQQTLDLHGLTAEEAVRSTEQFLAGCRSRGLEKVLIIHGKGNHSSGEPVLGRAVRQYLERCPHAGSFGAADAKWGGRGALWVLLRQRSR